MVESSNTPEVETKQNIEIGQALPPTGDISEVYDRIHMSGLPAAASLETMK